MSLPKICLCALCLLLLPASSALAHRLNVFAWAENGQVIVECNFYGSSPARGAAISVFAGKRELLLGKTNEAGRFEFPVPEEAARDGLAIVANAGEGHQNKWLMEAGEFAGDHAAPPAREAPQAPAAVEPLAEFPNTPLTAGQAQTIVHAALEKELAPIRRTLAEMASGAPTARDIIGGIGWILGLAGIWLYCKSSKSK